MEGEAIAGMFSFLCILTLTTERLECANHYVSQCGVSHAFHFNRTSHSPSS